ncbi:MAG: hypothetical protein PHP88_09845 [bacterium]|nr:hypothetical protein [bacterium]
MSKKKREAKPKLTKPPAETTISSLLIPETVGSGFTKWVQYRSSVERFGDDTKPADKTEEDWSNTCIDAWNAITQEQRAYANIETWTKQILKAANLPTENTVYTIPDGRPLDPNTRESYSGRKGDRRTLVVARGDKERFDIEWYAAQMLISWLAVKGCNEKGKTNAANLNAFGLGMLTREMQIRFEVDAENKRKGGSQKKRILAVESFVLKHLRTDSSLKPAALWHMIPDDNRMGLQIGKATLYRENDRLMVDMEDSNDDRQLSFASFRRYVTNAKKLIAS